MYFSKTRESDLFKWVNANSTPYFAGFSYNLNSISVRMCHSCDTNASVFLLEGVKKNSESASIIIKPDSEDSGLNCYNSHTSLNDKTLNLFEDMGETYKISLSRLKEERIVSAFPKAKSEHKEGPSN
jgi:hypothetical protein